ncbi:MAG: NusG domain II-containing protein, partial [Lachnospiraceae bacterium]|nr:NusG domain II-containing protein [Lachnospiraceae bacterium]
CMRQRQISRNGENIICLPHKLVIQTESDKEGAPDAVTY